MHVPSADELAAIAVAYLAVAGEPRERTARPDASGWRLAGRIETLEPELARAASRARSRWKIAGRLDG